MGTVRCFGYSPIIRSPIAIAVAAIAVAAAACSGPSRPAPNTGGTRPCPKPRCEAPRGFVDTPGALLRVFSVGSQRAGRQTVVLVHDWAHDSTLFDEQLSALRTRFHVVSYDLRGHGSSTDKTGTGGTIGDHADDLVAVIDAAAAEGESVHLVGNGLGGLIALEVARRVSSRVRSLTLIATLHDVPAALETQYRAMTDAFADDPASYEQWPGRLVQVWVSRGFLNERPQVVSLFDAIMARHDPASVAGTLSKTIDFSLTVEDLAKVDAPVLVMYGENDPFPGTAESEEFFGALAHVTRLRIPRAGHLPTLENAGAVNAALARHLGGS